MDLEDGDEELCVCVCVWERRCRLSLSCCGKRLA